MTMPATDLRKVAQDMPVNSLGFRKPPAQTRVVVAMSGGVDSSVVAAMLAAQGYDVIGVTLQLYDHGAALAKKGACCAGQDIHDARRVGLPFVHFVERVAVSDEDQIEPLGGGAAGVGAGNVAADLLHDIEAGLRGRPLAPGLVADHDVMGLLHRQSPSIAVRTGL